MRSETPQMRPCLPLEPILETDQEDIDSIVFDNHEEDVMYDDVSLSYYFHAQGQNEDDILCDNDSRPDKSSILEELSSLRQNKSSDSVSTENTFKPVEALSQLLDSMPVSCLTNSFESSHSSMTGNDTSRHLSNLKCHTIFDAPQTGLPTPDDTLTDELSSSSSNLLVDLDSELHTVASTAYLSVTEEMTLSQHEKRPNSEETFPIPQVRYPTKTVTGTDYISNFTSEYEEASDNIDWELDLIDSYRLPRIGCKVYPSPEESESLESSIQEALRDHPSQVGNLFSHAGACQLSRSKSQGHTRSANRESNTCSHIKSRDRSKRNDYILLGQNGGDLATLRRTRHKSLLQPLFPLSPNKDDVVLEYLIELWRLTRGLAPSSFSAQTETDAPLSQQHHRSSLSRLLPIRLSSSHKSTWSKCKDLLGRSSSSLNISPPLESPQARYIRLKLQMKSIPFADVDFRINKFLQQTSHIAPLKEFMKKASFVSFPTSTSSLNDVMPSKQQLFGLYLDIVIADLSWDDFCRKYSLDELHF